MIRRSTFGYWFEILRGLWRLSWGDCPSCNSMPFTPCDICSYGVASPHFWEERWLLKLRSKYL